MLTMTKYAPSGTVYGNPSRSSPSSKTRLRSSYSATCSAKKPFSCACSRPAAIASWAGPLQQKTIRVCAASNGWIRFAGPIAQPTRQPVAANDLPCGRWRQYRSSARLGGREGRRAGRTDSRRIRS